MLSGGEWKLNLLNFLSPEKQCQLSQKWLQEGGIIPASQGNLRLAICPWTICPPSPQENFSTLLAAHQPHVRPPKLRYLSSTGCKNSWKSASFPSPVNGIGKVFSCGIPCVLLYLFLSLSLPPLSDIGLSPVPRTPHLFLPQTMSLHCLPSTMWPLLFLLCSLFCQSSDQFLKYS